MATVIITSIRVKPVCLRSKWRWEGRVMEMPMRRLLLAGGAWDRIAQAIYLLKVPVRRNPCESTYSIRLVREIHVGLSGRIYAERQPPTWAEVDDGDFGAGHQP